MRWIPIGTILSRYSMTDRPMEVKLNEAVNRRIERENEFIEDLISQINQIILTLDECDPSNARTAIDLTQQQLSEVIFKLNDVTNMTGRTASIANIVKDNHLMRRPAPLPPVPITSPAVAPPPAPSLKPLGSIVNPGATPSNGRNSPLPIRTIVRGGKRTRRFRKK